MKMQSRIEDMKECARKMGISLDAKLEISFTDQEKTKKEYEETKKDVVFLIDMIDKLIESAEDYITAKGYSTREADEFIENEIEDFAESFKEMFTKIGLEVLKDQLKEEEEKELNLLTIFNAGTKTAVVLTCVDEYIDRLKKEYLSVPKEYAGKSDEDVTKEFNEALDNLRRVVFKNR